ncbi:MAG TPA: hypothetical protein PKD15_05315, partial [Candidatus Saccharibacteria bacterium]|nr:hypothetical protein [Candidatus Saccharibacteria bacterium]
QASSYYRHVPKQDKPYLRTKTKPVATGVIKQKNRETSRSIEVVGLASEEGDRSSVHTSLEEKNKLVGHSDEVRAARKAAAKVAWNMRNELVARKQRKTDAFIDKLNEF